MEKIYVKCVKCKGYDYVTVKTAQLYREGMTCNCGGKVVKNEN
jgi:hypothetical protein